MSKIRKADEVIIPENVVGMIYGEAGLGKSTLALSAPKPLLIDTDGGVHRIQAEYRTDTVQVESYQDIIDVLEEDLSNYETIVIDTFGNLVKFMLVYFSEKDPKLLTRGGTYNIKIWGLVKAEFSMLATKLRGLGKSLIFVAHQSEERSGEETKIRIKAQGGAKDDVLEILDFLGYMEMFGKRRSISFTPNSTRFAKNSIKLDDLIQIPVLEDGQPNDFLEKEIIQKSLERRLQEQKDNKIKNEQLKQARALVAATGSNPNKCLEELKKVELCNAVKIMIFGEIKNSTDMKWNVEKGVFE